MGMNYLYTRLHSSTRWSSASGDNLPRTDMSFGILSRKRARAGPVNKLGHMPRRDRQPKWICHNPTAHDPERPLAENRSFIDLEYMSRKGQ